MLFDITRRKFLTHIAALSACVLFDRCKFGGKPLVYFIGDSLTKGIGTSAIALSYPHQTARLISNIDFEVFGYPGLSANEYYNQYLHNLIVSSRRNIIAVVFFGANDLTVFPVTKVYDDIVNVHRFLNDKSVKTIVIPVLNRKGQPDFDSKRLELNKLLKANYKKFAAGFVDPANAPQIYNSNAPDNYQNFSKDGVHLTDSGAKDLAKVVAKELKKVIASYY